MSMSFKLNVYSHLLERHGMDGYIQDVHRAYQRSCWRPGLGQDRFAPVCGASQTLLVTGDWYTDAKKARYTQDKLTVLQAQLSHYLTQATGGSMAFVAQPFDADTAQSIWHWLAEEKKILEVLETYTARLIAQASDNAQACAELDSTLPTHANDEAWKNSGLSPMVYWALLRLVRLASVLSCADNMIFLRSLARALPHSKYRLLLSNHYDAVTDQRAYSPCVFAETQVDCCAQSLLVRLLLQHSKFAVGASAHPLYTAAQAKALKQAIESLPSPAGYRLSVAMHVDSWSKQLLQLIIPLKPGDYPKDVPILTLLLNGRLLRGVVKPSFAKQIQADCISLGNHQVWRWRAGSESQESFSVHVKEYPELPGLELAYYEFAMRLVGEGVPPSVLGRLDVPGKKSRIRGKQKIETIPLLLSQTVKGHGLNAHEDITSIDAKRYSQLFIMTVLTLVEDDKPDNFIVEAENAARALLSSIDNDHILVPPFVKGKLNFKSILLCLDNVQAPVHAEVKADLAQLDLEAVLASWLEYLVQLNHWIKPGSKEHAQRDTLYTAAEYHAFMQLSLIHI